MTKERIGELAYLFLKQRLKDEGFTIKSDFKRNLANKAKEVGVSNEEALEFVEGIVGEALDEIFAKAKK